MWVEIFLTKAQRDITKIFLRNRHKKRNFTFTGLRIEQQADFSININQTQYIKDIHSIIISRERRSQPDAVVTRETSSQGSDWITSVCCSEFPAGYLL